MCFGPKSLMYLALFVYHRIHINFGIESKYLPTRLFFRIYPLVVFAIILLLVDISIKTITEIDKINEDID